MRNIYTITWLTFQEARRRFVAVAALGLGLLFVVLYAIGLSFISNRLKSLGTSESVTEINYNVLLLAGLYVVHFLGIMLAIFASVDTVSGEINSHTIQAIVTKPVRRWEVLAGKWLGLAVMLVIYVAFLSAGLLITNNLVVGYLPPNLFEGLLIMTLEVLVLLSLSLLTGTRLSTLTNGVVLFMIYGLAFIGTWVEQIGSVLQVDGAVQLGIVTSLLMPVEALWRRAAYLMQPEALRDFTISPFNTSSAPSPAMVLYAAVYALAMLGLATWVFSRRDL